MEELKLISVLKRCTQSERKRFEQFIVSPYFNERQTIIRFVQYILSFSPDFEAGKLTIEKIAQNLLPNAPTNYNLIRQWAYSAFILWEKFWVHHNLKEEEMPNQQALTRFYDKHDLTKFFKKTIERQKDRQIQKPNLSDDYYYRYLLENDSAKLEISKREKNEIEENKVKYQLAFQAYILYEQLKYYLHELTASSVFGTTLEKEELHFVLKKVELMPSLAESPLIGMYYDAIQLKQNPSKAGYFSNLLSQVNAYYKQMSKQDVIDLYTACINYCISQANRTGDIVHIEKLFEIYDTMLNTDIIPTYMGHISPAQFKNIVKTALRLQKIAWAEQFIQNNKNMLPKNQSEGLPVFLLALCDFEAKRFDGISQKLSERSFADTFFDFEAQRLLICAYYELGEYHSLYPLINRFRVSIHRRKNVSDTHKKQNQNFAIFVYALTRANKDWQGIKEKIIATNHLSMRPWLLAKVEQLLTMT